MDKEKKILIFWLIITLTVTGVLANFYSSSLNQLSGLTTKKSYGKSWEDHWIFMVAFFLLIFGRALPWEKLKKWFNPKYNEDTLLIMSASLLLLFFTNLNNLEFRREFNLYDYGDFNNLFLRIATLLALISFPVYHAFSKREKSFLERRFLLMFGVIFDLMVGLYTSIYIIENLDKVTVYLLIFPLLNVVHGVFMALSVWWSFVTKEPIMLKQINTKELIVGLTVVLPIFLISQYIFKNYWAITLSICLVYTAFINEKVKMIFDKIISKKEIVP